MCTCTCARVHLGAAARPVAAFPKHAGVLLGAAFGPGCYRGAVPQGCSLDRMGLQPSCRGAVTSRVAMLTPAPWSPQARVPRDAMG